MLAWSRLPLPALSLFASLALASASCARRGARATTDAPAARGGADGGGSSAFPGAIGWAAGTPGGRGGAILRVTTLDGDGSGSLVDALTASGPRIVVNNYIHNAGRTAIKYNLHANEWGSHSYQTGQMSVVGNVFTYGPNTPAGVPLVYVGGDGPCEIYLEDNVAVDRAGAPVPMLGGKPANIVSVAARPTWPSGFVARPASGVRETMQKDVGARPWDRDAIDARIVRDALAGGGKVVNSERDVEGYPSMPATQAPFRPEEWDLATMTRKSDAAHGSGPPPAP